MFEHLRVGVELECGDADNCTCREKGVVKGPAAAGDYAGEACGVGVGEAETFSYDAAEIGQLLEVRWVGICEDFCPQV